MSSNRANHFVKRLLGTKAGYAGTLDPLATGILPIAVGSATRLISCLVDASKAYLATIQWGEERDTDDCTGIVTQHSPNVLTQEEVLQAIPAFLGDITQSPPQFSALKIKGKRACDRVRRGEIVVLRPRLVHIEDISLVSHKEIPRQTTLRIVCGKGTYIRSLARDLGRMLRVFGHIVALRRERVGCFSDFCSIPLEKIRAMGHSAKNCVVPPESALDDILATFSVEGPFRKGQVLGSYTEQEMQLVRLVCASTGAFLGLARSDGGQLRCVWKC
jgi:tRNA pseudouridine55 synthase